MRIIKNNTIFLGAIAALLLVGASANAILLESQQCQKENITVKTQSDYNYSIKWEDEKKFMQATKLATDSNQNIILVGNNGTKAFIIKYDKDGNELWNNTITTEYVSSLNVEKLENYELLKTKGIISKIPNNFDKSGLNAFHSYDQSSNMPNKDEIFKYIKQVFKSEIGALGLSFLFDLTKEIEEFSFFSDVAIAPDDSIVAVGCHFTFNIDWNNPLNSSYGSNIYVVKFSLNGDIDWSKLYSVRLFDWGTAVDIDSKGTIYVACNGFKIIDLQLRDSKSYFIKIKPSSGICTGCFFHTIDYPQGWSKPDTILNDISINPNNDHIWLAGTILDIGGGHDGDTDQDCFVVEFGSLGMKYKEWQYDSGSSNYVGMFDELYAMTIDENENVILAGMRAVQLGNNGRYFKNERNFVTKLSSNGEVLLDIEDYNFNNIRIEKDYARGEVKLRKDEFGNSKEIVIHTSSKSNSFYTAIYDINTGFNKLKIEEGNLGQGDYNISGTYGMAVDSEGNIVVAGTYDNSTYVPPNPDFHIHIMYYIIEEDANSAYPSLQGQKQITGIKQRNTNNN